MFLKDFTFNAPNRAWRIRNNFTARPEPFTESIRGQLRRLSTHNIQIFSLPDIFNYRISKIIGYF